jgi:hypothetical protein
MAMARYAIKAGNLGVLGFLAAAALAAACTPNVIEGDSKGVIVENTSDIGVGLVNVEVGFFSEYYRQKALVKADEHCKKFGGHARMVGRADRVFQFECVKG